jgi:hypothetical protein
VPNGHLPARRLSVSLLFERGVHNVCRGKQHYLELDVKKNLAGKPQTA